LIPLYMIGVFVSFTLSQAGMVIHWRRLRPAHWRASAVVNGIGAVVTGIVLIVVAMTKAVEGAWIVLLMIPVLVMMFTATQRHYAAVAAALTLRNWTPQPIGHHTVIVPISGLHRAVVRALRYASVLSDDVRAVYVNVSHEMTEALTRDWPQWGAGTELVIIESPERSLLEPLLGYIERTRAESDEAWVTVVLPEFVPKRLWHHVFHNQHALLIKGRLLFKPHIVVTSVPYHIE